MNRILFGLVALLLAALPASGHPTANSQVLLHFHEKGIRAELILPVEELCLGWHKPVPISAADMLDLYGSELGPYILEHIRPTTPDGLAWIVRISAVTPVDEQEPDIHVDLDMTPPDGAPVDRVTLRYDLIFHDLPSHETIVLIGDDWASGVVGHAPLELATMRDSSASLEIDRSSGSWRRGFMGIFRLGASHIAEGTDHLLFLLALLLPAPLAARHGRWSERTDLRTALRRIALIATSFTLGHSATLALGALGWFRLPGSLVEPAIAVSIFISAIHALVPVLRGKEVLVAGAFGLVHGLAFASTLEELGLEGGRLVSSLLAFNLGIEAVQLLVIAFTMPWLVYMAASPAYGLFRVVAASTTGIAAAAWFFERALAWPNPIGPFLERIAAHPVLLLGALIVIALGARLAYPREIRPAAAHPA